MSEHGRRGPSMRIRGVIDTPFDIAQAREIIAKVMGPDAAVTMQPSGTKVDVIAGPKRRVPTPRR
jgi:hypothetical protein